MGMVSDVYDIFGLRRMREVADSLEGLKSPCDAELNVDSEGYTLKTSTLEDLATAATFFRDAVDGKKNNPTPHIVVEVDTSRITELVREAQKCIDRAVENMHVVCADTESVFVCGLNGGMSTGTKFNRHFTDGGTPKKQVHIKISDIKRPKFIHSLCASTRDRKSISDRDFDEASFRWYDDEDDTHCIMKLHDLKVVGITRRHPDDTANEYIGKSLSFNRAFDKLEKAVLKDAPTIIGAALESVLKHQNLHVGRCGEIISCIAGTDVERGDMLYVGPGGLVYPEGFERTDMYHGGTESSRSIENGTIVYGHVFLDGEWKWMYTPKTETKSECTDKESDDITITMSHGQAKRLYRTLGENGEHTAQFWDLFHALK